MRDRGRVGGRDGGGGMEEGGMEGNHGNHGT